MENFALFNESFNINKTSTCHLTLQISYTGYSYCIVDTIRKKYVAIKNVGFDEVISPANFYQKIKEVLSADVFLNKSYKAVDLIFQSQKSTLVPFEYFDKNKVKSLFTFNHQLTEKEEIHFNKMRKTEAYNVFTIPSDITTLLVNSFPEIHFYHQATPLIENLMIRNKNSHIKTNSVLVNVNALFIDIVVANGDKLVLYNTFNYKNEADFVYFIMNILQQLNIKPEQAETMLTGDVKENSSYHKLITKYLPDIKFAKPDNSTFGYSFDTIPEYLLKNLLDLNRCE